MDTQVRILFNPMSRMVTMPSGHTVLDAIREAGIQFEAICGGKSQCGKCRVIRITGDCSEDEDICSQCLSPGERRRGYHLACLTRVWSDAKFTIPVESRIDQPQILLTSNVKEGEIEPAARWYPVQVIREGPSALLGPSIRLNGYTGLKPVISKDIADKIIASPGSPAVLITTAGGTPEVIDLTDTRDSGSVYGVAIDLGTTTIAALLVDITNGKILARASALNRQITYGEELVTRIAIGRKPSGLAALRSAAIGSINEAISRLVTDAGIEYDDVADCCIGGNTVMCWLFAGIDPTPLDYVDAEIDTTPIKIRVEVSGLSIHPKAWVWCLPAVSRFVGGDAVGDLITAGMDRSSDISLLIDLGTNGEIVLGNRDWLASTSCASGPAFEGAGLRCGMRAMLGAIEHVSIDKITGEATVQVIGDTLPKGICGSGIIDAAPAMAAAGILDFTGKIVEDAPGVRNTEDGPGYILVPADKSGTGRDIMITRQDMAYLMDTKAAVCGAISVLMMKYHLKITDIRHVHLAGAFGTFGSIDQLTEFGIIPEFPQAEFHRIGNGSLTGAYQTLIGVEERSRAEEIARRMGYIDLLVDTDFIDEYWAALRIPGKEELFPEYYRTMSGTPQTNVLLSERETPQ
ncbi:MAG: ASKHA domain-containing protein [Methanospirillum sp.]|uniref:ASKHA domain-containing protein n=1 Tax=Methanospirillum sp. TaxID=45200 RepID=UPI00237004FE|nr:ASKHA domain-containing protein [Methanospirillum sp.]MDD1728360.1 ASKHA domain-containing protein [Methanospirillum sp.]